MSKSLTNTVTVEYTYADYTGKPLTTSCYVTNTIIHAGVNAVKSTCKKQMGPNENIYYIGTYQSRTAVAIGKRISHSN